MDTIQFQIYDYMEADETVETDSEEEGLGKYIIHVFGRTEDSKSVYAKIINYKPYFYILLPDAIQTKSEYEVKQIVDRIFMSKLKALGFW